MNLGEVVGDDIPKTLNLCKQVIESEDATAKEKGVFAKIQATLLGQAVQAAMHMDKAERLEAGEATERLEVHHKVLRLPPRPTGGTT